MDKLQQTLKELEKIEQQIQEHDGNFSEEELNEIVAKAASAFELTQIELEQIGENSRIELEKLLEEKNQQDAE